MSPHTKRVLIVQDDGRPSRELAHKLESTFNKMAYPPEAGSQSDSPRVPMAAAEIVTDLVDLRKRLAEERIDLLIFTELDTFGGPYQFRVQYPLLAVWVFPEKTPTALPYIVPRELANHQNIGLFKAMLDLT